MFRGGSPASGIASFTGGTIKVDDGAASTPSYSFTNETNSGFYRIGTNVIGYVVNGTGSLALNGTALQMPSSGTFGWTNAGFSGALDTILSRASAAVAQLAGASNAAAEFRVAAGNGGFISQVKSVSESLTIAAAATTVGATSIPAGAILLGVAVRVTTVIPTAATFTITTTVGGTTLTTAAVSSAANSTDPGTAAGASYRAAATTVTITPNLTPGAATGVVRLQYYYLQVTPPTS